MRHLFSILLIFLLSFPVLGQHSSSNTFRFLEMSPSARNSALGGNHVGLFDADLSQFFLNPAYLNEESVGMVSASYLNFLGEASFGSSSTAFQFENIGIVGFGLRFISYGKMNQLDENGNHLGIFYPNDVALTGGYSYKISENWRTGAAMNLIYSSYVNYNSSAVAVSGGLFYQDDEAMTSAGISIRNLGAQITAYDEIREPLPLDVSVGFSKKPYGFPFHLNLTFKQLNNWDLRVFGESNRPDILNNVLRHIIFGGEARFTENFHLRLGYDHFLHEQTKTDSNFSLAGIAYGIGIVIKDIQIDVSRNSYSDLGGLTQISLKTKVF